MGQSRLKQMLSIGCMCACLAIDGPSIFAREPDQAPTTEKTDVTRQPKDFVGQWAGQISLPGATLKVQADFKLKAANEGEGLKGMMDIPQQASRGLVLEPIVIDGETFRFSIKGIPGNPTFNGKLADEGVLSGEFTQGEIKAPFTMKRGELPKATRKQNPRPPFPYDVVEVKVPVPRTADAAASETPVPIAFELAGTLTKPKGEGPFTAVVLVTGSGPQNRDEEIMDHRPFWVIADDLTRAGYLVLRCDDRGFGGSGGDFASATSEDFANDALACVRFLKANPMVSRVGIIGHSEGGMIAPMVAAKSADVSFIVMLAGTAMPGHAILTKQNEIIAIAAGVPEAEAKKIGSAADRVFTAVNAGQSGDEIRERVRELVKVQTTAMSGGAEQPADAPGLEATLNAQCAMLTSPWFRFFLRYDPREAIEKVKVPVLALNGDLDVQVDADLNLAVIEAALKQAGNKDATIQKMKGLNHLFQRCGDGTGGWGAGGLQWYATNPETFNPEALKAIREWLIARFPVSAVTSNARSSPSTN